MTAGQQHPRTTFFEQLEGPRILIRPYRPDDAETVFQAIDESRQRLLAWLPWAVGHRTPDEAHAFILRVGVSWQAGEGADGGVLAREGGAFLGGIGLHPRNWDVPSFEIGYWLRSGAEGHGYMSEAVNVLTRYAAHQLGANRVEIRCDSRNARSAAVAERQGFVREARLRNQMRTHTGDLRDTLIFSLTPADPQWPRSQ